jgi:hypothetical protein
MMPYVGLIVALLVVFLGLIACFSGYRLFMTLIPMWGFFTGLWLGITGLQSAFGETIFAGMSGLVFGIFLGMILAVLAYFFYFLGVFILGASIGYGLTTTILVSGFDIPSGLPVSVISIGVALLFAVLFLALNAQKYLVIFLTAFGGAGVVITGLLLLLNRITFQQISTSIGAIIPVPFTAGSTWWFGWFVLALLGILTQTASTRKYKPRRPPANRFDNRE